jgi:RimJ/RimL family protein N-acetyltransferase
MKREDLERHCQHINDVEVELLGGGDPPRPCSLEAVIAKFEEDQKDRKDGEKSVNFAIEADGKFIGTCGIWRFNHVAQICEMGIGIGDRDYWGRGYGREAIGLLLDYAFRLCNFRKVYLSTSSNNERAIRCYRACGFVEEGRLRQQLWSGGTYVDEVDMGILRDEWQAGNAAKSG